MYTVTFDFFPNFFFFFFNLFSGSGIRIRIHLQSWIRIRIHLKSWIRIRIQSLWIQNTGFARVQCGGDCDFPTDPKSGYESLFKGSSNF
jgi:hypothetical protein